MPLIDNEIRSRSSVTGRTLAWVVATIPLQGLSLLGSNRRLTGEHAPFLYALLLGLAWLGCVGGLRRGTGEPGYRWVGLRGELFLQASVLMLLVSLARHAPGAGTVREFILGLGILAAIALVSWWDSGRNASGANTGLERRGVRLLLMGGLAVGAGLFGASIRPSEHYFLNLILNPVMLVGLPSLLACGLAFGASRLSGFTWTGDHLKGHWIQFSTRPSHAAVVFLVIASSFESRLSWIAFPMLLVLFGFTAAEPVEPNTPPRDLGRLYLPLALPLLAAAALHIVDPPAVLRGDVASHAIVGIFFVALAPVLPVVALVLAPVFDLARRVRGAPILGTVGIALLLLLAIAAPLPQVALAQFCGRDLTAGGGSPVWFGLPLAAVYQAQALAGLALVAWMGVRAWKLFRGAIRPGMLPLIVAAVTTVIVAELRIPIDGAAGAAQALMAGALAGLLLEARGLAATLRPA